MKVVNITDIEDLVLAKHEIDTLMIEHGDIETRSDLTEFSTKVAIPNYIYIKNDRQISFGFINVYDNQYLFIANDDETEINILKAKLKAIKYNLSNLNEIPRMTLASKIDMDNVIIHEGKFYI